MREPEFHTHTKPLATLHEVRNKVIYGRSDMFVLQTGEQIRFQVLTAASIKSTVLWDIVPCGLVDVYRRFRVLIASIIRMTSHLSP
jgi:hypothetical protein